MRRWAVGTPIAISDVGGARELLTDPQAGRIVERTPDALAEALHEMLTQTPNRVATRKAALRFTWSTNGNGLFAHLAGIAESAT